MCTSTYMESNYLEIKPLLDFTKKTDDYFYSLFILKRKKENSDSKSTSVVRVYYIENIDYLERKMTEIFKLCELFNARAYINLRPVCKRKLGFNVLKIALDKIESQDNSFVHIINSAIGKSYVGKNYFLLDIDINANEVIDYDSVAEEISNYSNIAARYKTKNGYHYILEPFNPTEFRLNSLLDHKIQYELKTRNSPALLAYL